MPSVKPLLGLLGRLFTEEGAAIKGPAFNKRSKEVLDEIMAGQKGAGPLDLSGETRMSGVEQKDLPRYEPPRGISPRLNDALRNPDVLEGVRESIRNGMAMGAHRWYHTEPIRQAFIQHLGPEYGPKAFEEYMTLVSSTSPRSDVPVNIRNASYYYQHAGEPLGGANPYPYGHVAQQQHRGRYSTLSAAASEGTPWSEGWDILKNPKPPSYGQNLMGNLQPVAVDTHAFRNIGMRTRDQRFLETSIRNVKKNARALEEDPELTGLAKEFGAEVSKNPKGETIITFRPQQYMREGKLNMERALEIPSFWAADPNPNEYGAAEHFYKQLAKEFGLHPAEAQAAAWAGAGKLTGLGTSPTHTFPEMFNERALYTARMRNEDPADTLRKMITRQAPFLGLGGTVAGGSAIPGLLGTNAEDQY